MNSNWIESVRHWTKNGWLRLLFAFLLLNGTIALTITWFLSCELPWGRILLLWGGQFLTWAVLMRARAARLCLVYLATVVLVVGGFELWLALRSSPADTATRSYPMDYYQSPLRDVLGYGPKPSSKSTIDMHRGEKLVYSATYSYDSLGQRVTPNPPGADTLGQIALFGCSFTLGEGLQDTQTTAWNLALLAPKRKIWNFGFHGYGPHQMLAMLEGGHAQTRLTRNRSLFAIYQAIPDHVRRVAGLALYDRHGPHYRVEPSGDAEFVGHFDDDRLRSWLRRSAIWQRTSDSHLKTDSVDIALWGAIVDKSRQLVEGIGNGSRFQVILWDIPAHPNLPALERELQRRRLSWVRASDLVPGLAKNRQAYFIPGDDHPSALADHELATALWTTWIADWVGHGH